MSVFSFLKKKKRQKIIFPIRKEEFLLMKLISAQDFTTNEEGFFKAFVKA